MDTRPRKQSLAILLALTPWVAAGGMVVSLAPLTGCASEKVGVPSIDTATDFAGPAVEVADADTFIITTPTGGWEVEVDQSIRDRFGIRAFATLTRPAADAMTTTALAEHTVRIPGGDTNPVALYLRIADPGERNLGAVPYRLAATTAPRP